MQGSDVRDVPHARWSRTAATPSLRPLAMEEAAAARAADGRDAFRMRSASEDPESQLSNAETHASPASAAATDDSPAKSEDARAAGSTPQRTHAAAELGSLSVQAAAPQRGNLPYGQAESPETAKSAHSPGHLGVYLEGARHILTLSKRF